MKLFIRNFILKDTLPEIAVLFPYRDELLKTICKFDSIEKISVKNNEFLAYICKYNKKNIFALNTGIGNDNLLLLMKEIIEKGVKHIYLFNKALSISEEIKIGNVIIPTASAIRIEEKFIISPPIKNIDIISNFKKSFGKNLNLYSGLSATFPESQIVNLMKNNTITSNFVNIVKELKELNALCITTLDYNLFNFAHLNDINAYSILYVSGTVIPEAKENPIPYLENLFSLFLKYLSY